ncbi:MAG: aminotransferase class III-fold pyridoxal phosphate-dependent enzyme [Rhodospirillales bacterium]|nr:aminotransferase class III-fold pyridoxal phosphate-dependent enzyme [Rhodospirillales bacterium]
MSIPNSLSRRDPAVLLHPQTDWRALEETGAFAITGGEGVRIREESGQELIEGMSGLWCASLGFSEKRLVEAATKQMSQLPYEHVYSGMSHGPAVELAETLLGMAPAAMQKVFFACSGSEANDTIVRMIWYYNNALGRPRKKKMIARRRAFHGSTCVSGSLTGLPHLQSDFDLPLPGFVHTTAPHHYHEARPGEDEESFATRLAEELEELIIAEGGAECCAAFIAEPVMGAGGVILPPAGYFPKIKAVLDRYDMLMIADEVICGFCRTGNMWGSETFDIQPDFMTVAKALSSAYAPISAVMMTDRIYQVLADNSRRRGFFGHGFTYSAHPLSAAVALETLKIYAERDVLGHVRSVAPTFLAELRRFADHPLVGEARGTGLIGAIEVVADKATHRSFAPAAKVGARIAKAARDHGLITRAMGDSLGFCPPLIITAAEIREMFTRFGRALDEVHAGLSEGDRQAA